MTKTNHFYIDETGHINNDSKLFAYGCIKTDTPNLIENALANLKDDLKEDALLAEFGKRVSEENFHATEDPFDIRTAVYRLLPYLNFRSYFTVLLKNDDFYKNLKKDKEDFQIIESMIYKLIEPRVRANKSDLNIFYFETLEIETKSLSKILEDIFNKLGILYNVKYVIVNKDNPNIPVIDYINFVLYHILTEKKKKKPDWSDRVFEVLKNKIALIHFQNDDSYYSRNGIESQTIELNNLKNKLVVD